MKLTRERIQALATRPGVRRVAVENFLGTLQDDEDNAMANLKQDARVYGWNLATISAIRTGIQETFRA